MVMSLWGDPESGLPIRVEMNARSAGKEVQITMSDFVFNVDLDESLFSVEPPAGYTTQRVQMDASAPEEKDLIETLRQYSQQSGGTFPDAAVFSSTRTAAVTDTSRSTNGKRPGEEQIKEGSKETDQAIQESLDAETRLTRGLGFVLQLPRDADVHYAGKGVSFGAADKPIFWYRPKDAKKYRVIYADLSVRDADAPPGVPNAQSVPGSSRLK